MSYPREPWTWFDTFMCSALVVVVGFLGFVMFEGFKSWKVPDYQKVSSRFVVSDDGSGWLMIRDTKTGWEYLSNGRCVVKLEERKVEQ